MRSHDLVRSPLNYTGGKYRLLPQLMPLFPATDTYTTFIDAFGGGGNVVANVPAARSIYNDFDKAVTDVLTWMATTTVTTALGQVDAVMAEYALDKENSDGYYDLRAAFNADPSNQPMFYTLVAHGFNNQIRFNRHGHYNIPFGKRTFNGAQRKRFTDFAERLQSLDLTFVNGSFDELDVPDDAFVYCDPPYLITHATYNKETGDSVGWGAYQETALEKWLDGLTDRGVKWALSNVTHHQGKENTSLIDFAKRYTLHELDFDYKNASYHKKDRDSKTIEVLVTNY
ncbi:Dam family site-specific DNA-(adenine-N6)-methyltransferase [Aeromicrobium sp. 179-A 4D2 NHS]|uniref:Dam family site-specific DNA-(adenine-N6)-methyltransferase n=1 Tax=Aeromicrobium sp. 179-A 4D2 NHS TaxID=3142375 RepID=UPI0039A0B87E